LNLLRGLLVIFNMYSRLSILLGLSSVLIPVSLTAPAAPQPEKGWWTPSAGVKWQMVVPVDLPLVHPRSIVKNIYSNIILLISGTV
jgi:hypothetical protein